MNDLTLSLLMCLASALAYAGAAIVQERVAEEQGPAFVPWRRPAWWGAVSLNGSGAVLHVLALAYGPLTLVQPLGALTIVFALPMAALLVGRKAGATAWRGALMATVGLAGLLALTGSPGNGGPDATERTLLVMVTGATVCVLAGAALAAHRHPAVRGGLLAAAGGVAFGIASVFTKIVTQALGSRGLLGQIPDLAVVAVLAVGGLLLSQASYRGAGLAAPLATVTVVNPVAAAAVGIALFGEGFRYGTAGTVLALSCGVVAAGGLILLTTERMRTHATASERRQAASGPAGAEPAGPEAARHG
ncbi:DMT family transporter [Streptomyces sp. CS227]|uniref:DMT family transporter n=1 Tax=Streptomyces sp. CS227 TaxID=1982763 RepID=UPI00211AE1DA|nr:DMT family transporter [Streptomyces sp. CS227]